MEGLRSRTKYLAERPMDCDAWHVENLENLAIWDGIAKGKATMGVGRRESVGRLPLFLCCPFGTD